MKDGIMFKVKTVLLAALLATSVSVTAQEENVAGSVVVPGLGEVSTATLVAGAVGVAVVAAVISNSDGDTAPPVVNQPKCNGTDPLVNNVCVGSREEVVVKEIVTGTGTATATATTTGTALVSFTYAPTL
jgi:hypothetical protein